MLKTYALIVAGLSIVYTVSLPSIAQNLLHVGVGGVAAFIVSAVVSTTPTVQFLSAIALCMALLLVRDSFRVRTARFN
jgi:hypothetical protein